MPYDNLLELFDVCDALDNVVGQAPRGEVHARNLLHRAVHIWVFNSDGRLLVHRRSATKDEYPLCFTSSASGHLASGEDYRTAAGRELAEELGLTGDPEFVIKIAAAPETAHEHTALYQLVSDAVPTPDPIEIESIVWWTPAEVSARLQAAPAEFSPPFRELWWATRGRA